MKKNERVLSHIILALFLAMTGAYAKSLVAIELVPADKVVENVSQAIHYIEKNSELTVMFPNEVPPENKLKLFAAYNSYSMKSNYNQFWMITFSTHPHCQVHSCVKGSMSAEKNGKLVKDYIQAPFGLNHQPILKQKVKLAHHTIIGYYTPGHAEADWHAPNIEWQVGNVLYQLTWDVKENAKQTLTTMADFAIQSSRHR